MGVSGVLKGALLASAFACGPLAAQSVPAQPKTAGLTFADSVWVACGPLRGTDSLRVNSDTMRNYVAIMGQQAGERQLVALADTAHQDESWLYFPNNSSWLEVGYKTVQFKRDTTTEVLLIERDPCLELLSRTDAVHYTLHPADSEFVASVASSKRLPLRATHNLFTALEELQAMPTSGELVQALVGLVRHSNKGRSYEARIASQLGIARLHIFPDANDLSNLMQDGTLAGLPDRVDTLYTGILWQSAGASIVNTSEAVFLGERAFRLEQITAFYRNDIFRVEFIPRDLLVP